MKTLIALLIVVAVYWVARELVLHYQTIDRAGNRTEQKQEPLPASAALPGMPPSLELSLDAAQKQGAAGLRTWLYNYRVYVRDPRLAAIELDYVVLISRQDPVEARRIFKEVQQRTPLSSPIHERVKRLEKTFQ